MMNKIFLLLALASFTFFGCSKNDDADNNPPASNGASTAVFYVDTLNIYSTDLKGANRKLVTSEGSNTGNNYIAEAVYVPKAERIAYIYTEAYDKPFFLKTCKLDGSDKKTIKTFAAFTDLGLIKATADGQIIYTLPGKPFPNQTPSKTFSIKADGTGEAEINVSVYAGVSDPDWISADGKGVLLSGGYFALIVNGTFDERNSFNVLANEEKDQNKISEISLSNDATKLVFAQQTSVTGKYEIRIKDVKKDAPTSTVLYTLNIPADADQYTLSLSFVSGTKYVLASYGKFTSPKGAANDYTNCDLIETASGKVAQTWKFMGDEIYNPFSN
ncbi:hypothetical protein [Pelobium manganitolerans]|nr:hypothetical protein [Pelobium manganitolerans]